MKKNDPPAVNRGNPEGTMKGTNLILVPHNVNVFPAGSFAESDAYKGVSKFEKNKVKMRLGRLVRWGKYKRVVVKGMPFFIPTEVCVI